MLTNIKPEDILFLDIETVPAVAAYSDLDQVFQVSLGKEIKTIQD